MLFLHTWKYVISGQKTQNRRLVQEGDYALVDEADPDRPILKVIRTADAGVPKPLYEVGKTYSVQPGLAKKTVGNIKLTAIRRERLQDLTEAEILKELPITSMAEGVSDTQWALRTFMATWNIINSEPGTRWEDNPEVWVLEFEPALKAAPKKRSGFGKFSLKS
jgi:hypothetical protein